MPRRARIGFMNENFPLLFVLLGIAAGLYGFFIDQADFAQAFLGGFLFYCVGLMGLMCAAVNWNRETAAIYDIRIGYPVGNPFQRESAAAKAAFGVLGVLSFFGAADFWTATIIGWSIMTFIMAVSRLIELKYRGNCSIYNSGALLWYEIFMPMVMIFLLVLWKTGF